MAVRKVLKHGRSRWRARVKRDGRVRTAYCEHKDEALRAEAELLAELDEESAKQRTVPTKKEVPTLAEFADDFLDTYAKTNNRPSTVREKRRTLKRALLPTFGTLALDQIGPRQIEEFKAARLASKTPKGTKPAAKTINEELAILTTILRVAYEWGEIDRLPRIRRLKVQMPGFDFLDFEEADRLIEGAVELSSPWCAMIPIACWTGLRLGELRGLEWDHVDLVARRIRVCQSADDEGELYPPKNNRSRIVDLPDRAVRVLRAHKHLRGPFVFCRENGSMLGTWECESKTKQARDDGPLARLCRRIGLRRVGWHVLRHTYASHLVMRGAKIVEVQQLLGHASLITTMRYVHLSPRARRTAVDLLERNDRGVTTGVTKGSPEEKSGS